MRGGDEGDRFGRVGLFGFELVLSTKRSRNDYHISAVRGSPAL